MNEWKEQTRNSKKIGFFSKHGVGSWVKSFDSEHYLKERDRYILQVNLCQKLLFLHQLTHNMTTDCSLNYYKFNTWKFQAQTWGEHVVYRNCFWHSEQFLYTTCSPHVLQKEELLTKIYLYLGSNSIYSKGINAPLKWSWPTLLSALLMKFFLFSEAE